MNPREEGFLLLTSHLGDPDRRPLTVAQLRQLAQRVTTSRKPLQERELEAADLVALGCDSKMTERILQLLSHTQQLKRYVRQGNDVGCIPITRVSHRYPELLRKRLGVDAPGCLWAAGDLSLLDSRAIALVGSREAAQEDLAFACEAGRQAARQGYVLVSGNARGADSAAQQACLEEGGRVISVVADRLSEHRQMEGVLYLSEDSFDAPFSPTRALSRNRVIHCLAQGVLVAGCTLGKGGTWDGTTKNLRFGWSPVGVFSDGSKATGELVRLGACGVSPEDLQSLDSLFPEEYGLF